MIITELFFTTILLHDLKTMLLRKLTQLLIPYKWYILLSIFLGLLTICAAIGLMASSGYLISWAALQPPILDMILVIVAVRFFGISRGVLRYLERLISHDTTFRILSYIRVTFFSKISRLPAFVTDTFRSSSLLSAITSDVDELQNFYLRVVAPTAIALLASLASFYFLSHISMAAAWVMLLFLGLNGIALPLWVMHLNSGYGEKQLRVNEETRHFWIEHIQGMEEIKLFNLPGAQKQKSLHLFNHSLEIEKKQSRLSAFQDAFYVVIVFSAVLLALIFSYTEIASGSLDRIFMALTAFTVMISFEATQNLGSAYQYLGHSLQSARHIYALTDQVHTETEKDEHSDQHVNSASAPRIDLRKVCFSYNVRPVLHDISLTVNPGEKKALVGPTGCGKSTILHLISGFYKSENGSISTVPLDDISVIEQNSYIFNDTLRNNLLIADTTAKEETLIQSLKDVSLFEWYQSLPDGLETLIGEFGKSMSGGERQRLALARAVLRNTSTWILDEPSTNQDTLTESLLLSTIHTLACRKTVLWVTHRFVQMDKFDEIVVMHEGRITEKGTHEELLLNSSWYRETYTLQQDCYT
ncbi:thiol reductant ABC exporter subunit CydC [Balneolaceae bacterium ANBcel3]|nr:thiol reductant ABC exporter subunit CydC [Balneolaceae bacterium ANBcel3]